MKKLLLLTLWLISNNVIAETVDEKRYRTSPFLTQSKVVASINAKVLANQFKNLLNEEERQAFVDTVLVGDVDFDINDLPAAAAGNVMIDESIDEKRYRTSPFSKETDLSKKVEILSGQYRNVLDDMGRAEFDDIVLAEDIDINTLPATAAGSVGCKEDN